jgi:glycosyltransferase involved in cell wall biosynthesis
MHFADAAFAITPLRADAIRRDFRIPEEKIHVWPSSVSMELFNPNEHRTQGKTTKRNLGIATSQLLLYHGGFGHDRGLYELVRAMSLVRQKRKDIVLLLLGEGPAELRLRDLVQQLGLNETVLFHKSVHYGEVPRFIAAADAGIIPLPDQEQWRYQNPTKLLEYLAMEKPVILTDIPAHRLVVDDHKFAFFCRKGLPLDIAKAIIQYSRCKTIPTVDERVCVDAYSPEAIARRLLGVFSASPEPRHTCMDAQQSLR